METILITGATGQIGRRVVELLVEQGQSVKALVKDKKTANFKEKPNLEIVEGIFEDISSLEQAIRGVKRLFLVARDNPQQVEQHNNVITVAERYGVKHIVKLSAYGAGMDSPISLFQWHAATEEQLRKSNMIWTFLRPHLFMQNLLRFSEQVITTKQFSAPMGQDSYSLVDTRDVAEIAAKILVEPKHDFKIYTLTGPRAVTYAEIAQYLTKLLGHQVDYHPVNSEKFYEQLLSRGIPEWRAYDLAYIVQAYPNGANMTLTDDIPKLLGRPARDVKTFLMDHIEYFSFTNNQDRKLNRS